MPSLSAYTPFESLLFFQSLAPFRSRPASFAAISDSLCNNPCIRQNAAFSAERFSPEALEDLYTTSMQDGLEKGIQGLVAALSDQDGPSSPKKRKIANSHPESVSDVVSHAGFVPELVSHLYARYKESVTTEIRFEERRYQDIKDEIVRLQEASAAATKIAAEVPDKNKPLIQTTAPLQRADVNLKDSGLPTTAVVHAASLAQGHPNGHEMRNQALSQAALSSQSAPEPAPRPSPPDVPLLHQKTTTTMPLQQPQFSSVKNNTPFMHHPPSTPLAVSSISPAPVLPAPQVQAVSAGKPSAKTASTAQPLQSRDTLQKTIAAPSPSSMFQKWPLNRQPQTPDTKMSPHATVHSFPVAKIPLDSASRAQQSRSTPVPPPSTKGIAQPPAIISPSPSLPTQRSPLLPAQSPADSAVIRAHRLPRLSIDTSGSLTPWKSTPPPSIDAPERPRSPVRPGPEDVSPISERASSPILSPEKPPVVIEKRPRGRPPGSKSNKAKRKSEMITTTVKSDKPSGVSTRRRRAESITSSGSHGQSTALRAGEEIAGMATETRGAAVARRRGMTVGSGPLEMPVELVSKGQLKRKRAAATAAAVAAAEEEEVEEEEEEEEEDEEEGEEEEGEEGQQQQQQQERGVGAAGDAEEAEDEVDAAEAAEPIKEAEEEQTASVERQKAAMSSTPYVLCARNFFRTCNPLMNDVAMHKHASRFAKPLTERDAPGYRDLIYRPQDLKSIKSAIHQGSKAIAAATISAADGEAGKSPSPAGPVYVSGGSAALKSSSGSGPLTLMLPKSEDVIPPKAIVNSAQLEKELIRMFANAIMFNTIPQRGFGPAFPMAETDRGLRLGKYTSMPSDGRTGATAAAAAAAGPGAGTDAAEYTAEIDMKLEDQEGGEGGIIKDTLEMFEDVEKAVMRWRAAERTGDEINNPKLRRTSISDINTDSMDETR